MTGKTFAKMIVVQNLLDSEAWPWKADWYRSQIAQAYGESAVDDVYRLWFVDNANHWNGPIKRQEDRTRIVHYDGFYYRALLDLADWVETGIAPAPSNQYTIHKGQVKLKDSDIGGIQPSVALSVNGEVRALVPAGEKAVLKAVVKVPKGQGQIVRLEWDAEGRGEFVTSHGDLRQSEEGVYHLDHVYEVPGTYLPAVRVASHKQGDVSDRHALAYNLGRARVVVQ